MGLNEKRIITSVTETEIPKWRAVFKEKTGTEIALEVDWGSFGETFSESKNLSSSAGDRIFKVVAKNFEKVCADSIGKQAVASAIKTIKLANRSENDSGTYSLTNGMFSISLCFVSGALPTDSDITKGIESVLG